MVLLSNDSPDKIQVLGSLDKVLTKIGQLSLDKDWIMLGFQIFPPDEKYTLDKAWINFGLGFILDNLWTWTNFGLCLDSESHCYRALNYNGFRIYVPRWDQAETDPSKR